MTNYIPENINGGSKVDWRLCPQCGTPWPHPSSRKELYCWPGAMQECETEIAKVRMWVRNALAALDTHSAGSVDADGLLLYQVLMP
jgi:hypothetical protein